MKRTKTQKGITLVSLIVTVIVLLILAVVSIRAVTDNGIIAKAKEARSEYEQAQENEQALLDTYLEYLNNEMKPSGGSGSGSGSGDSDSNTFASITAADYGKRIEYNDPAGVNDWKVFYKDDNYLYIITSDYLENSNLPSGLNMSTSGTYVAYWDTTDNFTATGAENITTAVASKYKLSWLNDNSTSTNENARATADLLNTTAWTAKFGDTTKGIEAIGSPTLEMWIASWNAKGYTHLNTEYDSTGYYVGTSTTPKTDSSCSVFLSGDTNGYADILYFPHRIIDSDSWSDNNRCWGYWLASPCCDYASLNYVYYNGSVTSQLYDFTRHAVRPLVSIPKSLVTTNASGNLSVAQ